MTASFATEGTYTPDGLIAGNSELLVSRKVTVISGQNLARGAVLGKITASGKYVAYSNGAADGSEVAAGVLFYAVPDAAVDQKVLAITRGAEVIGAELTGLDAPGTADLKALSIIVR